MPSDAWLHGGRVLMAGYVYAYAVCFTDHQSDQMHYIKSWHIFFFFFNLSPDSTLWSADAEERSGDDHRSSTTFFFLLLLAELRAFRPAGSQVNGRAIGDVVFVILTACDGLVDIGEG